MIIIMINSIILHPALPILIGALIILRAKGVLKTFTLLIAPLISLFLVWMIPDGANVTTNYLDWTLEPFKTDKLSRLFATVFVIMALAGNIYALKQERVLEIFAANIYISFSLGVVFAGDLITVFVFWELMALASATVIFSANTISSQRAGMRYIILHLLGGVVLMAGIAGEVTATGSVAFNSMLPDTFPRMLILAGFLLNTGAPPFSAWVADSYPEASYSGMVFLSAFTTKTAVYVLARGFPGAEVLIFIGLFMIFYGIIYGLCENNARKMLGYSIVNQVGFMVTAIGIGTQLAINGAVAHAFAHIIYKALLIMSLGSVLFVTGKRRFTEYGGLFRTMPLTAICCIIGGLSISAFPFTSGFVAKAMMSEASYLKEYYWVWYLLAAGTAGVFLDVGIKLQYFVFFGRDSGLRPPEPPINMRISMVFFAILCLGIGFAPTLFYQLLPFEQDYYPYTPDHIVTQFQLLLFSGAAFFVFLKYYGWQLLNTLTLDFDWIYRVFGYKLVNSIIRILNILKEDLYNLISKMLENLYVGLKFSNGPGGYFSKPTSTGQVSLWIMFILALYLFIYLLI
ncbi:MAG: Na(+)/H(+) antiporter subunit D [Rhodospirillaceae bacterium]|nr:Na(+)/H(+) antiporter subunit D [Rhodospirillaceae bacterium]